MNKTLWMFQQGLAQRKFADVVASLGSEIDEASCSAYWRGFRMAPQEMLAWTSYPAHCSYDLDSAEISQRYIPYGVQGPLSVYPMTLEQAQTCPGCTYIGEDLARTMRIVIDVNPQMYFDRECLEFFSRYINMTACHLSRQRVIDCMDEEEQYGQPLEYLLCPMSFQLTFASSRVIPSISFERAHISILGNASHTIRYFKGYQYNGEPLRLMDKDTWQEIRAFVGQREKE